MSNEELAVSLLSEDRIDWEDIAKALNEAEARGRKAALEEAAKVARAFLKSETEYDAGQIAREIELLYE